MSVSKERLSSMQRYTELLKEVESKITELHTSLGLFWAFNAKQFNEGKTPSFSCEPIGVKTGNLIEGDVYVHMGAGGYCPKSNAQSLDIGIKAIMNHKKEVVVTECLGEEEVLYMLRMYECFYTYDLDDAFNVLVPTYTKAYITSVFSKHLTEETRFA